METQKQSQDTAQKYPHKFAIASLKTIRYNGGVKTFLYLNYNKEVKGMKRVLSILLCTVMLFTLSTVAFAAEGDLTNTTLSVNNAWISSVIPRFYVDSGVIYASCDVETTMDVDQIYNTVQIFSGADQLTLVEQEYKNSYDVSFSSVEASATANMGPTYQLYITIRVTHNGSVQTTYKDTITLNSTSSNSIFRTPSRYGQNKSNWCWAVSAIVVAENNFNVSSTHVPTVLSNTTGKRTNKIGANIAGDYTADSTQRNVVYHVKKSEANNTGDDQDRIKAMTFVSGQTNVTSGMIGSPGTSISSAGNTMNSIKNLLAQGKYVIANYKFATNVQKGHSIVLKEYDVSMGLFRTFDPWTQDESWKSYNDVFVSFVSDAGTGPVTWAEYCY